MRESSHDIKVVIKEGSEFSFTDLEEIIFKRLTDIDTKNYLSSLSDFSSAVLGMV